MVASGAGRADITIELVCNWEQKRKYKKNLLIDRFDADREAGLSIAELLDQAACQGDHRLGGGDLQTFGSRAHVASKC
jgi:hypothetical protein